MEYQFEKGTAADIDAILENIKGVRDNGSTDWDEDYPTRVHIGDDLNRGGLYVLRARDGGVAASMAAHIDDEELKEELSRINWTRVEKPCLLSRLCVRADLQGKGLAKIIMFKVIDLARASGCGAVCLMASEQNAVANGLYRSLGFACLGNVRVYDWPFIAYEMML